MFWRRRASDLAIRDLEQAIHRIEALCGFRCALGSGGGGNEFYALDIDEQGYHRIFVERGGAAGDMVRPTLDEFLYALSVEGTRAAAPGRGIDRTDWRRIGFPHQVEVLGRVSPAWAERIQREQAEELQREPFDDDRFYRM